MSNALLKSMKRIIETCFLFNESSTMCWDLRRACSHDLLGQRPYCMSCKDLFFSEKFIFSYILEKYDNRDTGLQFCTSVLVPSLYIQILHVLI